MNERKTPGKLLKVVSILDIIFGALGLISSLLSLGLSAFLDSASGGEMNAALSASGITPNKLLLSTIFSLIITIVGLVTGIVGLMYRSRKTVLICGVAHLVLVLLSLFVITPLVVGSFSPLGLLQLIIPVLYLWGWYQSE